MVAAKKASVCSEDQLHIVTLQVHTFSIMLILYLAIGPGIPGTTASQTTSITSGHFGLSSTTSTGGAGAPGSTTGTSATTGGSEIYEVDNVFSPTDPFENGLFDETLL